MACGVALFLLAGCSRPAAPPPLVAPPPAPAAAVPAPLPVPSPEPPERTRLYERLAGLLAPRDGNAPAYGAAAAELERYLEGRPDEERRPEVAALRALLAREAAPAPPDPRLGELEAELRELRERVERLDRENRELLEVVERLKALEVDMEQKRRRVR